MLVMFVMRVYIAGDTVRKYFEEHNPNVETLASQSSLAEWIVDLTTEVRAASIGFVFMPLPVP